MLAANFHESWRDWRRFILSISTLRAALRFRSSSKSIVSVSISLAYLSSSLFISSLCFFSILLIISRSSASSFRNFSTSPGAVVKGSTFCTGSTCASSLRDFRFSTASLLGDINAGPLTQKTTESVKLKRRTGWWEKACSIFFPFFAQETNQAFWRRVMITNKSFLPCQRFLHHTHLMCLVSQGFSLLYRVTFGGY